MLSPRISIIVPVYKAETYLQECIDSILAQTFQDFELILVDDGSPDSSGSICDANASRDSRIRVIHQTNQGATRARANGVASAKGEFLHFVDSDDTLPTNALETLIAAMDEETDIVLGRHQKPYKRPTGEIGLDIYRRLCCILNGVTGTLWANLYRRSIFDATIFDIPPEVRIGEDAIANMRLAYKIKGKVRMIDSVVYHYRDNEESTMHTCSTPEVIAIFQKHRLSNIPPDDLERFLPLGLASDMIGRWLNVTRHRIQIPSCTMEAQRYLLSIRKYSDIKFDFYTNFLFYCTNTFLRAIVIGFRNCIKS